MKNLILILLFITATALSAAGQENYTLSGLMNEGLAPEDQERLVIRQDPAIDTLVNRHILANAHKEGVDGWRIQIYRGGHRTASEDANKIRAKFMEEYPDVPTYLAFDRPNWFKVKVGDFRTREEAAKLFFTVQAEYPEAYLIRDVIAFSTPVK